MAAAWPYFEMASQGQLGPSDRVNPMALYQGGEVNRNERIAVFVENPRLLDASPKVIQRVLGRGAMEVRSIRDAKAVARRHLFLMDSAQPLSDSALPGRAG